jgi:hypothetical protein
MAPALTNVVNEQLATLALSAATELDRIARGKGSSLDSVKEFAAKLPTFSRSVGPRPVEFSLDPDSSEMFSAAVTTATKKQVADLEALAKELAEIASAFEAISARNPTQAIPQIKDFCLAIHDFVMRSNSQSGLMERGVFDYEYSYSR